MEVSMYSRPFGSIFGDDSKEPAKQVAPKPGFLDTKDDPKAVLSEKAAPQLSKPLPSADPAQDPMADRKKELERVPVINPGDGAKLRLDREFVSETPELELAEATHEQEKSKFVQGQTMRAIKALQQDIKKAEVYKGVLLQYGSLSEKEKDKINLWLANHFNSIKNFGRARKLLRQTQLIKEKAAGLDVDIKHWDRLKSLKKQGKLKTAEKLSKVKEIFKRPKAAGIPIFDSPGASEHSKEMTRAGVRGLKDLEKLEAQQLGDAAYALPETVRPLVDTAIVSRPPTPMQPKPQIPLPKKSLYSMPENERLQILEVLKPDQQQMLVPSDPKKQAETRWADAKQREWKLQQSKDDLKVLQQVYAEHLSEIQSLVSKIIDTDGEKGRAMSAALGTLTEGNPEGFLEAADLQDAVKNSFNILRKPSAGLGEIAESDDIALEKESELFLQQATLIHQTAQQELQAREYALDVAQAEVKDAPPPPPPKPINIEVTVEPKSVNISINHILLAAAGIWALTQVIK